MPSFKKSNPYAQLLSLVRDTLIQGQQRVEDAKIMTYWQTGDHINKHVLKYSTRAEYGGEVISRLVNDLKLDKTTLHDCLKFAKTYPKLRIIGGRLQFKWSHFRELIWITDEKKRKHLEAETQRNGWTSDELIERIKAEKAEPILKNLPAPKPAKRELLTPLRGQLYTYKIINRPQIENSTESGLSLDLGFGASLDIEPRAQAQLREGDFVVSHKSKAGKYSYRKKTGLTDKDRFTYYASIEKIIDADTYKVNFDLGFKVKWSQTLRLRGLDAPELKTKEGVAAKNFVMSYIKQAQTILVRSFRDDKYGRYLADVFILSPDGDTKKDIYLNNLLLQNGHAVRM